MVAVVFKKFEARKVKGQKSTRILRSKGKSKPIEFIKAPTDTKMTECKYM
jgi:hypothetical protein